MIMIFKSGSALWPLADQGLGGVQLVRLVNRGNWHPYGELPVAASSPFS